MPWSSSVSSYQNCFLLLSKSYWLAWCFWSNGTYLECSCCAPPECPDNFFAKKWWKGKFMSEHNGDILVIYTCCSENPIVFKLDQPKMVWREMKTLDGLTLFASFLSSHSRTDLPGMMRNSVYFLYIPSSSCRNLSGQKELRSWLSHGYYCKNLWIWINLICFNRERWEFVF